MAPRGESKRRLRDTAAELFRRQGYNGTGLNQIIDESGAPRGSLYFHYAGGKTELAIAAVESSGGAIGEGIEALLASSEDVAQAIGRVVDFLAADLRDSDFEHGCPVGSVALDVASSSEPIRIACGTIFEQWREKVAARLREEGLDERAAADEAHVVVALIEGALLVARAERSTAPLEAVARHVRAAFRA